MTTRSPAPQQPPEGGHHDLGGRSAGSIDRHEHTPTLTERRVDAMMMLLRDDKRHFFTTDEHRRTIESLVPSFYDGSEYYERWVHGIRNLMIEKGVLTQAEIEARFAEVKARNGGAAPPSGAASEIGKAGAAKSATRSSKSGKTTKPKGTPK